MTIPIGARAFDRGADAYAATIARTLLPVARRVVERAQIAQGDEVLDAGTGTGNAAAAAVAAGASVTGIDAAPAMIDAARRNVPGARFDVMDFGELSFADETFDAVMSSHALLFAADQLAVLREWRRVAKPGGRLSLSVPGPRELSPTGLYADIYERHGVHDTRPLPTASSLAALVTSAGWRDATTDADPTLVIRLENEELFRAWRGLGSRAEATRDWSEEQHEALTREMLAATPRDAEGAYVIPFGALFLTARR